MLKMTSDALTNARKHITRNVARSQRFTNDLVICLDQLTFCFTVEPNIIFNAPDRQEVVHMSIMSVKLYHTI